MKKQDIQTIEQIIDRTSPGQMLAAISEICFEKAQHIRENWQDETLAKQWEKEGRRIARNLFVNE